MILAALPQKEYRRLLPHLEAITLPLDVSLYRSGDAIEYVYFPSDGIISLATKMNDGTTIEVGLIGSDGMAGIPVLFGDSIAFEEAIVQVAGSALRMKTSIFKEGLKLDHNPLLTELLLYTRTLMKQVAQTAACNRLHSVGERLSRWLLMCHDRVEADELFLKQEFISNMLGVRRASVGAAAAGLQARGLIRYARGRINILNRKGLEESSCECYRALAVDSENGRRGGGLSR